MNKKVFINSLPKAGTNLLANFFDILHYSTKVDFGAHLVLSDKIISKFNRVRFHPFLSKGIIIGIDTPVEIRFSYIERKLLSVKSNEYVTSHVGYTDEVLLLTKKYEFKNIVMIRDPRAVLNSLVHYISNDKSHYLHEYFRTLTEVEKFSVALNGNIKESKVLNSMLTRCNSISNWIEDPSVLCIRFEDLIGKKGGGDYKIQEETIKKILDFIDYKDDYKKEKINLIRDTIFGDRKNTFRKGLIDSWKNEIPVSLHKEINEKLLTILNKWGYKV